MTRPSDKVLERLFRLHPKKIDLSLDRMKRLLAKLGHPEQRLPPVIHVAGTNGKGSTIAYLRAILEAAGLRVHVYTSPHLVRFAERIRLAGRLIEEEELYQLLLDCEKINGSTPITYFEITTAIALKAFADHPADVILLEVGLGGRLDATNVVNTPLSTIITPVSIDHEQFLGPELAGIAGEKAGIAKKDVPLILADQHPEAKAAILDHAGKTGALSTCYNDWYIEPQKDGFIYHDSKGQLTLPLPSLHGLHQAMNAGLAIACLRYQEKLHISPEDMANGIRSVRWPARLQNITDSPYGRRLPKGSELWLDGGHNPAAGEILANHFKTLDDLPLYLISGMISNKDVSGFLKPLAPHMAGFYGINVIGEDSHTAEQMANLAQPFVNSARPATSTKDALARLSEKLESKPVRVLICGSLYLAGQILAENNLYPE